MIKRNVRKRVLKRKNVIKRNVRKRVLKREIIKCKERERKKEKICGKMFAYELQLDTTWKNHRIKTQLMQSPNPNYKFKHIWPKKNFTPRNPVGTLLSSLSSFE